MKILLAGPGTGKTTSIKNIVSTHGDGSKFLILSFTNATVKDLQESLLEKNVKEENCMTLHKFAVKYNHDKSRHILLRKEEDELKQISKQTAISFDNLCDFLDCTTFNQMIDRFVNFAINNPMYLKEILSNYDSLIVDEYQDFNPDEQKLIDILIETIPNSYILGDDDQCIYDFKDASSDKIISFYYDNGNQIIDHENKCYRCPDKVVDHATNLIQNNKKRVNKQWYKTGREGDIEHIQLNSFNDVAGDIADKIGKLEGENILILSPVGFALEAIIAELEYKNIEFTNFNKSQFSDKLIMESWEIKSLFGNYQYLNLVLLGYSKLSDRKKFYILIKKHFDSGRDLNALFQLLLNKLPVEIIDNRLSLQEFISQEKYNNIKVLFDKRDDGSDEEKLEKLFIHNDDVEEKNIKIMSIHKSKGLGADYVFIVGLNEGIIPNSKKGNDSLESQRRLFYVGMTRTKKQLFLYSNIQMEERHARIVDYNSFKKHHSRSRYVNAKSSSFISELKLQS